MKENHGSASTDWVVHVEWAFDETGLLEVWRDSELIVTKRGPNTYRDLDPQISLRIGIYKWPWSDPFWSGGPPSVVSKRVVFFDEVRIARE